ncbi:MAG TPA: sigma-70 family RNA polymerase sigma factor [Terriglobales bacterium]|nr:sigma-70 family RNA polymerase sigma factor [Terriglobales bacterium]
MAGQVTLSDTMLMAAREASGEQVDAAVEALVRDRSRLVYQIAYSILRNHHDAEDATQEVFLKVFRAKDRLADVRDEKVWIATIAWRVAVERSKKSLTVSLDDEAQSHIREGLRSAGVDALDDLAGRQMQAWLEKTIRTLPEDARNTLVLSTVQELNSTEIAEILKVPEGTVRTRLMRARKMLKDKLADSGAKRR